MKTIERTFALLDVLGKDRYYLDHRMPFGSKSLPKDERIPVVIHGFISHRWGQDDGTSIEFGVDVTKVTIEEGHMAKKATKAVKKAKPVKKPSKAKRKAA